MQTRNNKKKKESSVLYPEKRKFLIPCTQNWEIENAGAHLGLESKDQSTSLKSQLHDLRLTDAPIAHKQIDSIANLVLKAHKVHKTPPSYKTGSTTRCERISVRGRALPNNNNNKNVAFTSCYKSKCIKMKVGM